MHPEHSYRMLKHLPGPLIFISAANQNQNKMTDGHPAIRPGRPSGRTAD
jgi:hypothetical protein